MMVNKIEIFVHCFDDKRLLPTIFAYPREKAYSTLCLFLSGISIRELVLT